MNISGLGIFPWKSFVDAHVILTSWGSFYDSDQSRINIVFQHPVILVNNLICMGSLEGAASYGVCKLDGLCCRLYVTATTDFNPLSSLSATYLRNCCSLLIFLVLFFF
jgi:hypothetical protein